MTRVLLVDDQPMIRAGLTMVLSAADDLEVVGELDNGDRILDHVATVRPDVVCMDVRMPGTDGIEATRRLVESDGPPVCILTTFGEQDVLWAAVEAGAAGFELKSATPENLIEAIRTVAAGGSWIDGSLLGDLLEVFRTTVFPQRVEEAEVEVLTERELDVLRLMARGASNHEIADQLFLATTTVKTHVGAIFAKLGVRDRAAAIVHAFDAGIVTPRRTAT
ncbi:MAG: response regulator transcription factor [Actinomycetota bacterium]